MFLDLAFYLCCAKKRPGVLPGRRQQASLVVFSPGQFYLFSRCSGNKSSRNVTAPATMIDIFCALFGLNVLPLAALHTVAGESAC